MKNMGMQSLRLVDCTNHWNDAYTRSSGRRHTTPCSNLFDIRAGDRRLSSHSGNQRLDVANRCLTICARELLNTYELLKRIALLSETSKTVWTTMQYNKHLSNYCTDKPCFRSLDCCLRTTHHLSVSTRV